MMFQRFQEQDSHSSSGRSSADSSDLEDSASHRFSRVLNINDDSLTSEDNEDSDSAREGHPIVIKRASNDPDEIPQNEQSEPVLLKNIRLLSEDVLPNSESAERSQSDDDADEEEEEENTRKSFNEKIQNIVSYDEIYLASTQDDSENLVLLKSVRFIDPDGVNDFSTGCVNDTDLLPSYKNLSGLQQSEEVSKKEEQEKVVNDAKEEEKEEEDDDSAVMPDSLEVSMQDLEDSIEIASSDDVTLFVTSSPIVGDSGEEGELVATRVKGEQRHGQEKCISLSENTGAGVPINVAAAAMVKSDKLETRHQKDCCNKTTVAAVAATDETDNLALMAKTRKKWQIPASFDIKGIPSTHFLPQERRKEQNANPLLSATADTEELQPEDEEDNVNNNNIKDEVYSNSVEDDESCRRRRSVTKKLDAHDEINNSEIVRGAAAFATTTEQVGGSNEELPPRYGAVERRTPIRNDDDEVVKKEKKTDEEVASCTAASLKSPSPPARRTIYYSSSDTNLSLNQINNNHNSAAADAAANKYRSLVMITNQAAYQPVNVITSDTTTLLQPSRFQSSGFDNTGPEAAVR